MEIRLRCTIISLDYSHKAGTVKFFILCVTSSFVTIGTAHSYSAYSYFAHVEQVCIFILPQATNDILPPVVFYFK